MSDGDLDRRFVLGGFGALAAPALVGCAGYSRGRTSATTPFTLGVACGDPTPNGFVLWTRLAPDPLAEDGLGGLSDRSSIRVGWEIGDDSQMRRIVRRGAAIADPIFAHAVHVEVEGLPPGRPYWYRFTSQGHQSPIGKAMTAPAPGARVDRLRIAVASCAHYELGYFSAYRHMAAEQPDLTFFSGDYIYEYSYTGARARGKIVRSHVVNEAMTLTDYRLRYAQYKTDLDLQAVHAAAPCLMTWDDHEVQNDYANEWSQDTKVGTQEFLKRRAAGYRAFYEHMPLRRRSIPRGPDARIYDRLRFGQLAEFTVLDGRQYRTPQPCQTPTWRGGHVDNCAELSDRSRTMLGQAQEQWLYDGFRRADARWNVVAQDLLVAPLKQRHDKIVGSFTDGWDGYQANRLRMLTTLEQAKTPNPVFLGGDIHSFWATDLTARNDGPPVASEFVATAITQDPPPAGAFTEAVQADPRIRYFRDKVNGYFTLELTQEQAHARFQAISERKDPQASVATLQSFTIEAGKPGVLLS